MRKAAFLLLSTAAILIFVSVVITHSLLILQRVAAVDRVEGMAWICPRGHKEFVPLADRPRVAAGDIIRTNERGLVDLRYLDGTRMRIGPNSHVTVLKSQYNLATKADTQLYKLDLGRIWIRILKVLSQKSKFEVITPTATAGVRGTIFSVEVTPEGKTIVSVQEGKVALRQGEAQQELPAGTMSADGAVQPLTPQEKQLWEQHQEVVGPYLQVKKPTEGQLVKAGEAIEVSGVSEPGAQVSVNGGAPLPLKLEKLFSTTIQAPSQPGPYVITVQAKDPRGLLTQKTIKVHVAP